MDDIENDLESRSLADPAVIVLVAGDPVLVAKMHHLLDNAGFPVDRRRVFTASKFRGVDAICALLWLGTSITDIDAFALVKAARGLLLTVSVAKRYHNNK